MSALLLGGVGGGSVHGKPPFAFAHALGHEPWKAPNVGQASRLPGERASASGSVPSALPTGAGETPALRCGSWKVNWRGGTECMVQNGHGLPGNLSGATSFGVMRIK